MVGIVESPSIVINVFPADSRRDGWPVEPDLRSAATWFVLNES